MNAQQAMRNTARVADNVAESVTLRLLARLTQVVLLPVLLPVLYWAGNTFIEMGHKQTTMGGKMDGLIREINDVEERLEERTEDLYTGSQATRDWVIQMARDNRQDADRQRIENRVDRLVR